MHELQVWIHESFIIQKLDYTRSNSILSTLILLRSTIFRAGLINKFVSILDRYVSSMIWNKSRMIADSFLFCPRSDTRLKTLCDPQWRDQQVKRMHFLREPQCRRIEHNLPYHFPFVVSFPPWVAQRNSVTKAGASTSISRANIFLSLFLSFFHYILSSSSVKIPNDNEFWLLWKSRNIQICGKSFFFTIYIFV